MRELVLRGFALWSCGWKCLIESAFRAKIIQRTDNASRLIQANLSNSELVIGEAPLAPIKTAPKVGLANTGLFSDFSYTVHSCAPAAHGRSIKHEM